MMTYLLAWTKHFHEELELCMQGEAKLFSLGPSWSTYSRLGISRPSIKDKVMSNFLLGLVLRAK